jgi:hypothetical protein
MSSATFDQLLARLGPFLMILDNNTGGRKVSCNIKVREKLCLIFTTLFTNCSFLQKTSHNSDESRDYECDRLGELTVLSSGIRRIVDRFGD